MPMSWGQGQGSVLWEWSTRREWKETGRPVVVSSKSHCHREWDESPVKDLRVGPEKENSLSTCSTLASQNTFKSQGLEEKTRTHPVLF